MIKRTIATLVAAVVVSALAAPAALLAHEGRKVDTFEVEVGFLHEPAFEGQANGAFIRIHKPGVDLESHGALFASGTVGPGGNFQFEFGEDLEGLVVQFHDHLTANGGAVAVAHDAEMSGTVMVQFTAAGFSPSELNVQPGTTVMFMNMSGDSVMTVLSGPHDAADDHLHDDATAHSAMVPVLNAAASLQVEVTHVPSGAVRTMDLRPVFGQDGSYVADFVPTAPGGYSFRFFGEIEGEPFDQSFSSGPGTFDEIEPARNVQFPVELREVRELQGAVEGLQSELALAGDTAADADSAASTALVFGIVGLLTGIVGAGSGKCMLGCFRRKA
ncbi:MAG: hypothetical protein O3C69_05650 [Chloroflexi bacterium]|nr:hypothetical protein [Chloroflexota bacterium]